MGIVLKQSFRNTIIIYTAFVVGGINALFLYTRFLKEEYYGLVTYLLSTANLLMPLTAFGIQYTIVKFYTSYTIKKERDRFLSAALLIPLLIAIPIAFFGNLFYHEIASYLSEENAIIKDYTYIIYLVAIATAYFEIFYAWSKVLLKSVFGNVLKELYNRVVVMMLLFLVFFDVISKPEFIYYLTGAYFIRALIMMIYALKLYRPKFTFSVPENYIEVLKYSGYIILAGSAGAILLDIDKVMIPAKKAIEYTAYYSVGVYIGSVIEAPGRAMAQILQPLTAKALNEGNNTEVNSLYKKSSINLLLISGLIFLLINLNIIELYKMIPEKYSGGVLVVLMISFAKLYIMSLGSNGAIISNSKYYKILLPYGIAMALSVYFLNHWLIDLIGINGAALSTLIVILFFNTLKIWYVKHKFNMLPFTSKTFVLIFVIATLYAIFYFLNFHFHPIINIVLKSVLIIVIYLFVVSKLKISEDVNQLLKKLNHFKKGNR
ncbi:oligosaccharide flippase family protein [Flavobacteriaceae bacterium S356]|uniref:Oligosaccharide flippase family protein n=1 Tax=Asprobacillus argus TaxID=3076534 RepID=A0ABU3LI25_9FLAO|nr:oligosaccharide flippase family protein [Flavobacteriaceae bacterium S356]